MGTFEALKKGFELMKQLIPLVLIVFIYNAISTALVIGVVGPNPTPERVTQVVGLLVTVFLLAMFVWILVEGGLLACVLSQIKEKEAHLELFVGNCFKFFLRLFGVNIIGGLIAVLLWLATAIVCGVFVAMGGGKNLFFNAIAIILFAGAILGTLLVGIPIFSGHFIIVAENNKVFASLKKGWIFFITYFWRILFLFIILFLTMLVISLVVNFIGVLASKAVPAGWFRAIINITTTSLANGFISVFAIGSILSMILSLNSTPEGTEVKQG